MTTEHRPRTATVLAALDEDPGLTYREITERTGIDLKVVFAILQRLLDERRVINEANRWYPVPSEQDDHVDAG